jgi:hypothetical protein
MSKISNVRKREREKGKERERDAYPSIVFMRKLHAD